MDFKEYYVRDAMDKLTLAQSKLHIDDSTEDIIDTAKKIVRAKAEVTRRQNEAKYFTDENEFIDKYDRLYKAAAEHILNVAQQQADTPHLHLLLSACDVVRKAQARLNKAHTIVREWKEWKAYNKL
jgi:hypothetical protein